MLGARIFPMEKRIKMDASNSLAVFFLVSLKLLLSSQKSRPPQVTVARCGENDTPSLKSATQKGAQTLSTGCDAEEIFFRAGDIIVINKGERNAETKEISGFRPLRRRLSSSGVIRFTTPLQFEHFPGEPLEVASTEEIESYNAEFSVGNTSPSVTDPSTIYIVIGTVGGALVVAIVIIVAVVMKNKNKSRVSDAHGREVRVAPWNEAVTMQGNDEGGLASIRGPPSHSTVSSNELDQETFTF